MPYTTAAKAAAEAGLTTAGIQTDWLIWADAIIDQWRGELYPPNVDAVTEVLDGRGTDTLYLKLHPISGVTSVEIDGVGIAATGYAWYRQGYLRRKTTYLQYASPYLTAETWPEGVANIEVVYTPVGYEDLLAAVATSIVAKVGIFADNGGAVKPSGFTIGDYSERGGAYFGDAGLDGDIRAILATLLPRRSRIH